MLTGRQHQGNEVRTVNLWELERSPETRHELRQYSYTCKVCERPLQIRLGGLKRWHFAHKPPIQCQYLEEKAGEGPLHQEAKQAIADTLMVRFASAHPQITFEERIEAAGRIADVWVELSTGQQIAVEVQISPINLDDLKRRSEAYHRAEVLVIWVFKQWERAGSFQEQAARWLWENGYGVMLFETNMFVETIQQP